jgi:DNA-binding transcriptional ArsR family regulator
MSTSDLLTEDRSATPSGGSCLDGPTSRLLDVIARPTRLIMLTTLAAGEKTRVELAAAVGHKTSTHIAAHLKVLVLCDLIDYRRRSYQSTYFLTDYGRAVVDHLYRFPARG